MTTSDYLTQLIGSKSDIKAAIEEKGVTVSGGLSTYADAIREIDTKKHENGYIIPSYVNIAHTYTDTDTIMKYKFMPRNSCDNMFSHAAGFSSIPWFDTSSVTDMSYMFYMTQDITTIPELDTSNVVDMSYAFYYSYITTIPELDFSNCVNVDNLCSRLKDCGGFKNFGKPENFNITTGKQPFSGCNYLSKGSMLNIINNLYDRASAGYSIITLQFYPGKIDELSDEEIAIATNKGWIIS